MTSRSRPNDPRDAPSDSHGREPTGARDLFRREALDAWRERLDDPERELQLSPSWMGWAFAGVLLMALGCVAYAALATVVVQASGPALVRPIGNSDSLIAEAFFPGRYRKQLAPGLPLVFRAGGRNPPRSMTVLSVLPPGVTAGSAAPPLDPGASSPQVVVLAGCLRSDVANARSPWPWPGRIAGTARVPLGRETLLHILRLHSSHDASRHE